MTGFIKGLFRSKPKATPETEATNGSNGNGNGNGNGAAPESKFFFLDPDEAKTFGNIDYMRTTKSIRRSFPKAKLGSDNAVVRNISATEISLANSVSVAPTTAKPTASPTAAPVSPTEPSAKPAATESQNQRTSDSSMDLFRNMARDLRKR